MTMRTALFCLAVTTCGLAAPALGGPLRAGAAKVAITSTPDEFPAQILREKPFVGVHDDIFARALVLDDGARRLAIVSVETTTIPDPQPLIQAIAAAAQTTPANVLLLPTHTHVVPLTFFHGQEVTPMLQKELDRLKEGAVAAARDAAAHLGAARIASGRGEAYANTNNGEEASTPEWYDSRGSSDKTLDVVRVVGADGSPIAAMLNYATHGEVMFRSVTKDGGYLESGDLPGAVSRILEGQKGAAPVVLFTSAAEGDQLPLFKSLQPDGALPATDEGAAGWAVLDLLARRLSAAALGVIGTMPAGSATATIATAAGNATCPGQKFQRDRVTGAVSVADTAPVAIPIQVVRINDIALVAVSADLASNIGKGIKAASPVPHTSVLTMAPGAVGYVLNDAGYAKPGHGAMGSPVKPGCAPVQLPATARRLIAAAR